MKIGKIDIDETCYPGEDLYTDGDVEDILLELAENHSGAQLEELASTEGSWPVLYHFSPIRENIVSWIDIGKDETVLEIGSGCGAVTGALAKAAASVTCIELSKKRSLINANRHKELGNVKILLGNYEEVEKHLDEKFDVITLIGVFEYSGLYFDTKDPYSDFLKNVQTHLKPGGRVVIAIENRLGIKYFAGCTEDHSGSYFQGIEGYLDGSKVRTFSRPELDSIIENAGFSKRTFYYPYPDYKFPKMIFSDRFLPRKGELNNNMNNFDRDRMYIFNEGKFFDSLAGTDQFKEFSNSFLVIAEAQPEVQKDILGLKTIKNAIESRLADFAPGTIYSKFSNDRGRLFSIRTDITEEFGKRKVSKYAAFDEAEDHIKGIAKHFDSLRGMCEGTKFEPCGLTQAEDHIEFEYIEGGTLNDEAYGLLIEDREKLFALLRDYLAEIDSMASEKFVYTPEYKEVFSDWYFGEGEPSLPVTDIDMILENILVRDGKWIITDYEWTFDFPIPAKFVKWRVLYYFMNQDYKAEYLSDTEIRDILEITSDEERICLKMEEMFQEYVKGGHRSLIEAYEEMPTECVSVGDMLAERAERLKPNEACAFIDTVGGYFPPESRTLLDTDALGNASYTFNVKGVKNIRIDPGELPCFVTVKTLSSDAGDVKVYEEDTNGTKINDRDFVFLCEDPKIVIHDWDEEATQVSIVLKFWVIGEDLGKVLKESALDNRLILNKYNDIVNANALDRVHRNIALNSLKGTFPMRVYTKVRNMTGKGDPCIGISPDKLIDGGDITLSIDQKSYRKNGMFIRGWAYARYAMEETIEIFDSLGNKVPAKITRTYRDDVNLYNNVSRTRKCGFEAAMEYEDIKNLPLKFVITEPRGYLDFTVELEMDPVKRKERRIAIEKGEIEAPEEPPLEYDEWVRYFTPTAEEIEAQRNVHFDYEPLISIVIPLFNTPIQFLKELCDSILGQTYSKIELCLGDGSTTDDAEEYIKEHYLSDPRVKYLRLTENKGISDNTNAAMELASGDFIMLSDHDDVVAPNACFEIVRVINEHDDVDIVYTDEDKITMDSQFLFDPHFKPDFDLDLLRSNNYICHIVVMRREVVEKAGKLDHNFDGAQDYDFILRCVEKARRVGHVDTPVYHWRAHPASTAGNPASKLYAYENGKKAVQAHYDRLGIDAKVEMTKYWGRYRSIFAVHGRPLVSIIIPNKDHKDVLQTAIDSIMEKTEYRDFEIIVVENNSETEEIFDYYKEIQERYDNIRVVTFEEPFNYSRINNYAVDFAKGEYILFMNNDIEVIEGDWLTEMLGYAQRDDVGAVGAKLLFPDGNIQHVGVIVGLGGAAGHMCYGMKGTMFTPFGRGNSTQDLSAVTAACMLTKRSVFNLVGGFDEDFVVGFNDVDYCLKIRETGLLIVENVFAVLCHHESVTRGSDKKNESKEHYERLVEETKRFREKWHEYFEKGDPYYNKNLDLTRPDFGLRGLYSPYDDPDAEPYIHE